MEVGQHKYECRQNAMEDDWDRASKPALIGIKTHAQNVAKNHSAKIDAPEYLQIPAQSRARLNEIPAATVKIDANLSEQDDD